MIPHKYQISLAQKTNHLLLKMMLFPKIESENGNEVQQATWNFNEIFHLSALEMDGWIKYDDDDTISL